jgi:pyruvate/2-oxoglutarate dehydrogenase complex dihydrolipoamide acyltransferase (E2) component
VTLPKEHELVLPDLGLEAGIVILGTWLVEIPGEVNAGDRVVEILAGDATIDLHAPAGGILIEALVEEDDPLVPGQVLGLIREITSD